MDIKIWKDDFMLTKDELDWIRNILIDDKPGEISPSYFYKKRTEKVRNENIKIVRKELDDLRKQMMKITPQELLELRIKKEREIGGIDNFSGIYILYNCVKDIFYVGQSEKVFDRAYKHFVEKEKSAEIYLDYRLEHEFTISLIPLNKTSFSSLNELEDNAIRAYDSFYNGYNRNPGNILDKPIFRNEEYQKIAELLLDKIKGTESFYSQTNKKKRLRYIYSLFTDLNLPKNWGFIINFSTMIQVYQKANKKSNHKK